MSQSEAVLDDGHGSRVEYHKYAGAGPEVVCSKKDINGSHVMQIQRLHVNRASCIHANDLTERMTDIQDQNSQSLLLSTIS